MISIERLRELLAYNADTGEFIWLERRSSNVAAGSLAGCISNEGYVVIQADKKMYKAHRLAWLYVHGAWPDGQIDHRDGIPSNNRISNLRDVQQSVNLQNRHRAYSNNKCGMLGVRANHRRWKAEIRVLGKRIYLGTFDTPELAHAAYIEAKRIDHEGCTI